MFQDLNCIRIINCREMNNTEFDKYIKKAENAQRNDQKQQFFKKALNYFKPKQDGYQVKIQAMNQLSLILKGNGKLKQSKELLLKAKAELIEHKDEMDGIFSYRKKHEYIMSNLSLIQNDFAEGIQVKDLQTNREYRQCFQAAVKFMDACLTIISEQLITHRQKRWWSEQYVKVKGNQTQLWITDMFKHPYDDRPIGILKDIIEKAQKFNQLSKKKEHFQRDLFRCLYIKAALLVQMRKYQQAEEEFIKVYKYQKANKLPYLDNTREQIVKLYVLQNKFEEAEKYAIKIPYLTDYIQLGKQIYKKLMNFNSKSKQSKLKMTLEEVKVIFFKKDDDGGPPLNQELILKIIAQNMNLYTNNASIQSLMYYQAAEVYLKQRNLQKAIFFINKSLQRRNLLTNHQINECQMLKLQIQEAGSMNDNQIQKRWNEIRLKVKAQKHEVQIHQCQKLYKKSQIMRQRRNKPILIQNKQQNEMLQQMELEYMKKISEQYIQIEDEDEECYHNNSTSMRVQNLYQIPASPLEEYQKRCKSAQLPIRPIIAEFIKERHRFNMLRPLSVLVNLSAKEVAMLIKLINFPQIDLLNHHFDEQVLNAIKVNGQNASILKINGVAGVDFDQFSKVIAKMNNLQQFQFTNLIQSQVRNSTGKNSIVHAVSNAFFTNLKSLALPRCCLLDCDMQSLNMDLSSLTSIDLSYNYLKGYFLQSLVRDNSIKRINLGNNPLKEIKLFWSKQSKFDKVQLFENNLNQSQMGEDLCNIMAITNELDLSGCTGLQQIFDKVTSKAVENQERFPVKILRLRSISEGLSFCLRQLVYYLPQIQELDLRGSQIDSDVVQHLKSDIGDHKIKLGMWEGFEMQSQSDEEMEDEEN